MEEEEEENTQEGREKLPFLCFKYILLGADSGTAIQIFGTTVKTVLECLHPMLEFLG